MPLDTRELIDMVDTNVECVTCSKRARYCKCPDGPIVKFERCVEAVADVKQWGCPFDCEFAF